MLFAFFLTIDRGSFPGFSHDKQENRGLENSAIVLYYPVHFHTEDDRDEGGTDDEGN